MPKLTGHSLKRTGTVAFRLADRRQHRPETAYRCTCGAATHGMSRRAAHNSLLWHRQELRDAAALAAARAR